MPRLLRRCAAVLRVPANELAFALRAHLRWSRGAAVLPHEDKVGLFAWTAPAAREAAHRSAERLGHRYDLGALRRLSTNVVFARNLALLANLESLTDGVAWPLARGERLDALDVGCGDFHYATALQRFLARGGADEPRSVALLGCELDGHGIYRDGHSRADHARAHAALAEERGSEVAFAVADAARLDAGPRHVVTMFFPFVSAWPLLAWGLPLSRFAPRRLLRRAVGSLRPGGWLVVANQTEAEFARLAALLANLPVELVRRVPFASDLVPAPERTADQVGSLWRRLDLLLPRSLR